MEALKATLQRMALLVVTHHVHILVPFAVRYPPYDDYKGWTYNMQFPKLGDNFLWRWLR